MTLGSIRMIRMAPSLFVHFQRQPHFVSEIAGSSLAIPATFPSKWMAEPGDLAVL
jgi:hypothetical protein